MKDRPRIPLTALATLCFVTLLTCQTRFKISNGINYEFYPPGVETMDPWFFYGNPDRFKYVLRAFFVISSPVVSLISTGLLLFGEAKANPYFFLPWLFLTFKGLLFVQTDNLITMLRDMVVRSTTSYGFCVEDAKWTLLYFTIFFLELIEGFAFYEILDLFLFLWNDHPGYNVEPANREAVRKEMADIMETFSECSLGSSSKFSLDNIVDYFTCTS